MRQRAGLRRVRVRVGQPGPAVQPRDRTDRIAGFHRNRARGQPDGQRFVPTSVEGGVAWRRNPQTERRVKHWTVRKEEERADPARWNTLESQQRQEELIAHFKALEDNEQANVID